MFTSFNETLTWPLGFGWTAAILTLAVVQTLWVYLLGPDRRMLSGGLWRGALVARLLALWMLLLILQGPMERYLQAHWGVSVPNHQTLIVLADTSMSMLQEDMPDIETDGWRIRERADAQGPISRWEFLRRTWFDQRWYGRTFRSGSPDGYTFDSRLNYVRFSSLGQLEATGTETRLFAALHELARDHGRQQFFGPTGGVVVVLSDGHETHGQPSEMDVVRNLSAAGLRVLAVPVGQPEATPDVAISAWLDSPVVLDGQRTRIRARLARTGSDARLTTVLLRKDGQIVDRQQVVFDESGRGEATFVVRPRLAGGVEQWLFEYQVQTPPIRGEVILDNNEDHVMLEVQRRQVRVLLLEGQASWDTRFLIQSLRQDALVDLLTAHQLGDRRLVTRHGAGIDRLGDGDDDLAWPDDEEAGGWGRLGERLESGGRLEKSDLARADLVILGRRMEKFFPGSDAEELVSYATGGGAILLAAGRPFNLDGTSGRQAMEVFSGISPVDWGVEKYRNLELRWTEQGREGLAAALEEFGPGDVVLRRLPSMVTATRVERTRALTVVLAEADPSVGVRGPTAQPAPDSDGWSGESASPERMAAMAYMFLPNQGRVFAVLGDGLWRWAMLPAGRQSLDGVYQTFWQRLLQWLVMGGEFLPGEEIAMRLSENTVRSGGQIEVTVAIRPREPNKPEPELELRWIGPADGRQQQDETGDRWEPVMLQRAGTETWRWSAVIRPEDAGIHRLVLLDRSLPEDDPFRQTEAKFGVRRVDLERLMSQARPDILARLAEGTGGAVLDPMQPEALADLLDEIFEGDDLSDQIDGRIEESMEPRFNSGVILFFLCLFLMTEWICRRLGGAR